MGSSPPASTSRTVRVFISSTFRDFAEERDLLVRRVFPELRRRAREREVEVVDVDLRWGITEAEAERGETLSICLQEVARCRPFFVGLLGERYGWQPEAGRYPEVLLERLPWLREHQGGTSVTELEILHGVLKDPGMSGLAFFYLRDPAWSAARGADFASESADAKARLARLKERIRESGFPVVEDYASPQAVAERILEDLWSRIDARFPASEVPDEHEQERRRHEAFAQTRRTLYVGGESAVSRLLAHLDEASDEAAVGTYEPSGESTDGAVRCSRIVVVTGESGCGKSALLANAMAQLRRSRPEDLVFEHYLGSASDAGNADAIARRLCREVIRRERVSRGEDPNKAGDKAGDKAGMAGGGSRLGRRGLGEMGGGLGSGLGGDDDSDDSKSPRDADGLAVDSNTLFEELPEYLARGAALARQQGGRFVVMLDALDKLSSHPDASWLPRRVPPGVRLVLSTLEGPALSTARDRDWPLQEARRLTPESARQLVVESLARFNKRLDGSMLDAIASHALATLPIFLRVLTDELRVFGSHEELPARLSGYLACGSVESLHEQVLARVEGDLAREGGAVDDLASVLTALWASRRGLSEAEVVELAGVTRVTWSRVSLALDESLFEQSGRWTFSHDYLREAVAARYLPTESQQREKHASLAQWWDAKLQEGLGKAIVDFTPDLAPTTDESADDATAREPADKALVSRAIDELPWQWVQAASWDDLASCLLDSLSGPEIVMRVSDQQIFRWWQALGDHRGLKAEVEYERAWEEWKARSWRGAERIAEMLSGTLTYAGLASAFQRKLMDGVVEVRRRRAARLETPESLRDLSVSLKQLGAIDKARGSLDAARRRFEESLEIARDLAQRLQTPKSLLYLTTVLSRLGDTDRARGNLEVAMARLKEMHAIARELAERVQTPESQRCLSVSLSQLGAIDEARGNLDAARARFEESLRINRDLAERMQMPGSMRDLSVSLGRLGGIDRARGDLDAARTAFEESLGIDRDRAARLGTPESLRDLGISLNRVGDLALKVGDRAGARQAFEESLKIRRDLATRLGTPLSLRDLSASLNRVGDLALQEGDRAGAGAAFEESLKNSRDLAERLGTQQSLQALSISLIKIGDLALDTGNRVRAGAAYAEAIPLTREVVRSLDSISARASLAVVLMRVSGFELTRGHLIRATRLGSEAWWRSLRLAWDVNRRRGLPKLVVALCMPTFFAQILWQFQREGFWLLAVMVILITAGSWWFMAS